MILSSQQDAHLVNYFNCWVLLYGKLNKIRRNIKNSFSIPNSVSNTIFNLTATSISGTEYAFAWGYLEMRMENFHQNLYNRSPPKISWSFSWSKVKVRLTYWSKLLICILIMINKQMFTRIMNITYSHFIFKGQRSSSVHVWELWVCLLWNPSLKPCSPPESL